VQHVEFFHTDHFEYRYHRRKAKKSLSQFIDFFWETDFGTLWEQYPEGFSDALFPNIGYTYLINLGTPFVMQLEEKRYDIKSDGFLPRHKNMICHHSIGNKIFGIKFKVSPIIYERPINFAEYRDYIFSLAYLIDRKLVQKIREADSFNKRVELISHYYNRIIEQHAGSLKYVEIVTGILDHCYHHNAFNTSIEDLAARHNISSRTLQRYFEAATSISSKQALQIMRIRKALEQLTTSPASFRYSDYGYYDYSHFYKHLRSFVDRHTVEIIQPHLQLLRARIAGAKNPAAPSRVSTI
jgi:AraC-like DNA-binding protein